MKYSTWLELISWTFSLIMTIVLLLILLFAIKINFTYILFLAPWSYLLIELGKHTDKLQEEGEEK